MKKSYNVVTTYNEMRVDKWISNNLGKIPQSLIAKILRNGKIILNNKKIKSSQNIKTNDQIKFFNFQFSKNKNQNWKFLDYDFHFIFIRKTAQ